MPVTMMPVIFEPMRSATRRRAAPSRPPPRGRRAPPQRFGKVDVGPERSVVVARLPWPGPAPLADGRSRRPGGRRCTPPRSRVVSRIGQGRVSPTRRDASAAPDATAARHREVPPSTMSAVAASAPSTFPPFRRAAGKARRRLEVTEWIGRSTTATDRGARGEARPAPARAHDRQLQCLVDERRSSVNVAVAAVASAANSRRWTRVDAVFSAGRSTLGQPRGTLEVPTASACRIGGVGPAPPPRCWQVGAGQIMRGIPVVGEEASPCLRPGRVALERLAVRGWRRTVRPGAGPRTPPPASWRAESISPGRGLHLEDLCSTASRNAASRSAGSRPATADSIGGRRSAGRRAAWITRWAGGDRPSTRLSNTSPQRGRQLIAGHVPRRHQLLDEEGVALGPPHDVVVTSAADRHRGPRSSARPRAGRTSPIEAVDVGLPLSSAIRTSPTDGAGPRPGAVRFATRRTRSDRRVRRGTRGGRPSTGRPSAGPRRRARAVAGGHVRQAEDELEQPLAVPGSAGAPAASGSSSGASGQVSAAVTRSASSSAGAWRGPSCRSASTIGTNASPSPAELDASADKDPDVIGGCSLCSRVDQRVFPTPASRDEHDALSAAPRWRPLVGGREALELLPPADEHLADQP